MIFKVNNKKLSNALYLQKVNELLLDLILNL
jgi:hypothetical protein